MKKGFLALLFLGVVNVIKQYPPILKEIAMPFTQTYLGAVQAIRTGRRVLTYWIMSIILLFCAAVFFNTALFLAFFLLVPWSIGLRVLLVFIVGTIELLIALLWLRQLGRNKKKDD